MRKLFLLGIHPANNVDRYEYNTDKNNEKKISTKE